jgi:hypothetical protein
MTVGMNSGLAASGAGGFEDEADSWSSRHANVKYSSFADVMVALKIKMHDIKCLKYFSALKKIFN